MSEIHLVMIAIGIGAFTAGAVAGAWVMAWWWAGAHTVEFGRNEYSISKRSRR